MRGQGIFVVLVITVCANCEPHGLLEQYFSAWHFPRIMIIVGIGMTATM